MLLMNLLYLFKTYNPPNYTSGSHSQSGQSSLSISPGLEASNHLRACYKCKDLRPILTYMDHVCDFPDESNS